MRPSPRRRLAVLVVLVAAALAGCTDGTEPPPVPPTSSAAGVVPTPSPAPPPEPAAFRVAPPSAPAVVLDVADPVQAAIAASRALYGAAPVVVLAAPDDATAQLTAASAAVALGAPLLLAPPGAATPGPCPSGAPCPTTSPDSGADAGAPVAALDAELQRLGTVAVLAVGGVVAPAGVDAVHVPAGAGAAVLAAATGRALGAPTAVPDAGQAAAVSALARPRPALLGAQPPVAAPDGTPSPTAPAGAPSDAQASSGTASSGTASTGTASTGTGSAPHSSAGWAPTAPAPSPPATPGVPAIVRLPFGTPPATATSDGLPATEPPAAPAGTVALTGAGPVPLAVLATVRAAGLPIVDVPAADPRATSSAVEAIAAAQPAHVLALGAAFGPADRLAERVAAAATGVQLPGGGQLYFPQDEGLGGKRYVALYGSPGMPSLGVLGEQDVPATIARAQAHAEPYRALTTDTVVPGVEIIATIASAGAGPDGNYSAERPVGELLPLVQAAGDAGLTVVLDLQPGRTDFLTQAQEYTQLLELPYVSLALDPEWRLGPDQVHLKQIGSVGIDEVNAVAAWLAQLVADRHLPQKMLILHQFMLRMIADRDRLDTSHDELATVIHVDGQGSQGAKVGTWNAIRAGAPAGVHWGWKNFYDEDTPAMLDPAGTYAIQPTPDLVTYQ